MSENAFYADLDRINGKGVFVTGHGKGLVQKNPNVNGEYIANDMVRLECKNGELFGCQGYIKKDDDELTKIEYLLYFFDYSESQQPLNPIIVTVEEYLLLSKHNIEIGRLASLYGNISQQSIDPYEEYEKILMQVKDAHFISVPYTEDENKRVTFVNDVVK